MKQHNSTKQLVKHHHTAASPKLCGTFTFRQKKIRPSQSNVGKTEAAACVGHPVYEGRCPNVQMRKWPSAVLLNGYGPKDIRHDIHSYNTRQNRDLQLPRCRTSLAQNAFAHRDVDMEFHS